MQKGPHYICPQCHLITDSSLHKSAGLDDVQPINLTPPTFVMISEDKEGGMGGEDGLVKPKQEYDPEPHEDEWIKSIGATLISKKVQV